MADRAALVAAIQEEFFANDLQPPNEAEKWSAARLRSWFESGGCPDAQTRMDVMGSNDVHADLLVAYGIKDCCPVGVTFHTFWRGHLGGKQLASIKSCYLFNVAVGSGNKIVLWTDSLEQLRASPVFDEVVKYAQVERFDLHAASIGTPFAANDHIPSDILLRHAPFFADIARLLILLHHGGVWFDCDVFFLRPFGGLLRAYPRTFAYGWERQPYPNNAILSAASTRDPVIACCLEYLCARRRGFGFQLAQFLFDAPVPLLVLPCAWFDATWLDRPPPDFAAFFRDMPNGGSVSLDTFHRGAFAYHWHNQWNAHEGMRSPFMQLCSQVDARLAHLRAACAPARDGQADGGRGVHVEEMREAKDQGGDGESRRLAERLETLAVVTHVFSGEG